mmetsp:Transcript_19732/g.44389  ORF Transcript_19732/g.44389 Transcript_19732/m.44389 type:complete len:202 (-) Transcript_19732:69-674(-)
MKASRLACLACLACLAYFACLAYLACLAYIASFSCLARLARQAALPGQRSNRPTAGKLILFALAELALVLILFCCQSRKRRSFQLAGGPRCKGRKRCGLQLFHGSVRLTCVGLGHLGTDLLRICGHLGLLPFLGHNDFLPDLGVLPDLGLGHLPGFGCLDFGRKCWRLLVHPGRLEGAQQGEGCPAHGEATPLNLRLLAAL